MSEKLKYPLVRKDWPKIRNMSPTTGDRFMVDPRPISPREYFRKLVEAKTRAEQLATERLNRGTEAFNFSTENRVMAVECLEQLRPYRKTLREAVDHYVSWLKVEEAKKNSLLLSECLDQWIAARRADRDRGEFAPLSFTGLYDQARRFKVALGGLHISEMNADVVKTYLDSIPHSARTRVNVRLRLSNFLNFCRMKGWIDRVFAPNAAYAFEKGEDAGDVPVGLLSTRAALILNTGNTVPDREQSLFGDPLDRRLECRRARGHQARITQFSPAWSPRSRR